MTTRAGPRCARFPRWLMDPFSMTLRAQEFLATVHPAAAGWETRNDNLST
jgi:hypothetical protein